MRHVRRSLFVGALVAAACTSDNAGPGGSGVARLVFNVQPVSTTAGVIISPAVQVTGQNAAGDVVTTFTGNVTVSIGTNPGNATLSGALTVPAVAGVATFSDLRLNRTGSGYTLVASSGSISVATSAPLAIAPGPPLALAFAAQPTDVGAGTPIAPPVQVTARDSLGNTTAIFTGPVTVAIGADPGSGSLSGTKTQSATAGVATFDDLSINKPGAGYTLTAASGGLSGSTSSTFNVLSGVVSATLSTVVASPGTITASTGSSASTITVTAKDGLGNPVAGATVVLAVTGSGNAIARPGATAANGTTTGTVSSTNAESKTVSATIGGVAVNQTATVVVNGAAATTLVFSGLPSTAAAGAVIAPAVVVSGHDQFGNVATPFTGTVTVAIGDNPSGGVLSGTKSMAAVAGVATFNNLSIDKEGAGYTLTAAASGVTGATSSTFAISAGGVSAAQSTVVAAPSQITASSGSSSTTITVTAKDSLGNPIAGAIVVLAAGGSGNTLTQPSGQTNAIGVATGTLSSTLVGAKIVSATIGAVLVQQTDTVTVVAGAASTLAFTTQPTNTGSGSHITPAVQVTARDAFGNTASGFTSAVGIAIGTNPSGGTLSGTLSVAAVSGIVTYSDLIVDKVGTGYTLAATSGALPGTSSTSFNVTAGIATKLAFTVQPSTDTAGTAITPAVQVAAQDAQGNTVTTFTSNLTVAIGTNPSGGILSGTKTVAAGAGVVSFSNLSIDKVGTGYTLQATGGGLTAATSAAFNVVAGGVAQLAFTTDPTDVAAGVTITPAVVVTAQDALGNTVTGFSGSVTIAIGTNPSGGTLSGTKVRSASSGVATFNNLSIDKAGTAYTLTATAPSAGTATSAAFDVTAGAATQLAFTVQPAGGTGGVVIAPAIKVSGEDGLGNVATTFTGNVTVAIGTNPSGGALSGTTIHAAVLGVATFNNLSINKAGSGYTLTAAANGLTGGTSATFAITVGPAALLAFQVQTSDAVAGATITPAVTVAVEDAGGNVTAATNNVTLAIVANPGGGTLTGGASTPASGGVATFAALSINKAGTGYTLRATASGLTPDTSQAFNITAGSVSASQSQVSVTDDTIGQCLIACTTGTNATTVIVTVRDAGGNPLGSVPVVLTVSPVPGTHPPDTVRFTNPGPSGTTNGSGVFSAIFNSGVAVSTTVKATASGTLITQQPVVAVMPVLLAAGDIADCTNTSDDATANMLDSLPGAVLAIGDNAYPNGRTADYSSCYTPTWGRPKILARTHPVPGNHEYDSSSTAAPYFAYFGSAADPLGNGNGFYSFNLGTWHILALNSEIPMSTEESFVRGDLAGRTSQCVLAYWHRPRFTVGPAGDRVAAQTVWQALVDSSAEIVLGGHDHNYERYDLLDGAGNANSNGVREFVVGTGGGENLISSYPGLGETPSPLVHDNSTFGLIRITLLANGYRWEFLPAPGFGSFNEAGTGTCH